MSIITALGRLTHCRFELDVAKNKRFNLVAATYYTQGDKDQSNIGGLTAACGLKKSHTICSFLSFYTCAHTRAHTQTLGVCKWRGQSVTSVWNAGKGRGVLMCSRYRLICVLFGNSKLSLCYTDEVLWILKKKGREGKWLFVWGWKKRQ